MSPCLLQTQQGKSGFALEANKSLSLVHCTRVFNLPLCCLQSFRLSMWDEEKKFGFWSLLLKVLRKVSMLCFWSQEKAIHPLLLVGSWESCWGRTSLRLKHSLRLHWCCFLPRFLTQFFQALLRWASLVLSSSYRWRNWGSKEKSSSGLPH